MSKLKIVVFGIGYVGLANSVLLSQNNTVLAVDIDEKRVEQINNRISPFEDVEIKKYMRNVDLDLEATSKAKEAVVGADYIVIATPTNYDEELNCFDTTSITSIVDMVYAINNKAVIIIKSTVAVGFTKSLREKYNTEHIYFSPEFLREGQALYDNLYPSRIIVGGNSEKARRYADLLIEGAIKKDVRVLFTGSSEAEAIKLFSNTYLALRVTFFNELDTYAEIRQLNTKEIIEGVCLDDRVGNFYNNPSFGYGGYCLPKDTKQLKANYQDIPEELISAIVESNETRKNHIAKTIIEKKPKVVGVFSLAMKLDSDNYRESSIQCIIKRLRENNLEVVIYEPNLNEEFYLDCKVENDISKFKKLCNIIITNRFNSMLEDVKEKVYTRDLYHKN